MCHVYAIFNYVVSAGHVGQMLVFLYELVQCVQRSQFVIRVENIVRTGAVFFGAITGYEFSAAVGWNLNGVVVPFKSLKVSLPVVGLDLISHLDGLDPPADSMTTAGLTPPSRKMCSAPSGLSVPTPTLLLIIVMASEKTNPGTMQAAIASVRANIFISPSTWISVKKHAIA